MAAARRPGRRLAGVHLLIGSVGRGGVMLGGNRGAEGSPAHHRGIIGKSASDFPGGAPVERRATGAAGGQRTDPGRLGRPTRVREGDDSALGAGRGRPQRRRRRGAGEALPRGGTAAHLRAGAPSGRRPERRAAARAAGRGPPGGRAPAGAGGDGGCSPHHGRGRVRLSPPAPADQLPRSGARARRACRPAELLAAAHPGRSAGGWQDSPGRRGRAGSPRSLRTASASFHSRR